jgi:hypothetical protein
MINSNFNSDALAELLKNAPTIKVDVSHAIIPTIQPILSATPEVNVNPPPLLPATSLNINTPKKSNNTLLIISLSLAAGYGIFRYLRWLDERNNNTNK